jgi:hypothetical protein
MTRERDEVLMEFLDATDCGPEALDDYRKRYPEYAADLDDIALYSAAVGGLKPDDEDLAGSATPEAAAAADEMASRLYAEARNAMGKVLFRKGMLALVRSRGIGHRQLARQLGLGLSVLTKLERRLIEPSSLPSRLVTALADALGEPVEDVHAYLQLRPRLSHSASYRAYQEPMLGASAALMLHWIPPMAAFLDGSLSQNRERETSRDAGEERLFVRQPFNEAIAQAPDMTAKEKEAWLRPEVK